jgi:hypothetical protein
MKRMKGTDSKITRTLKKVQKERGKNMGLAAEVIEKKSWRQHVTFKEIL